MTTLDDCLKIQTEQNLLVAPTDKTSTSTSTTSTSTTTSTHGATASTAAISSMPDTVQIVLTNTTTSDNLYVCVTGLDINNDNAVFLLESDGTTGYYPSNPSSDNASVGADIAINVGGSGSSRTITVPQLAGARIWFSQDTALTFQLNQGTSGPALVEPSVTNTADLNYKLRWDFCEFTFNSYQLFVNVTYVDFISIPVALQLESTDGSATQTVEGIPSDGLDTICTALQEQEKVDCAGWDQLVVQISTTSSGTSFLRALSPNSGIVMNSSLFDGYYQSYVDQVWAKYVSPTTLTVDTQGTWGDVTGAVDSSSALLQFGDVGGFPQPSAADIFSCSSGAFASYTSNTDEMGNLTARLAAAFNRSTLLTNPNQPDGEDPSDYYTTSPTNHYARIVHAANLDGRGYAFPYDDVAPTDGADQSGSVSTTAPKLLTITIGGGAATSSKARAAPPTARTSTVHLREMARPGRQLVGGYRSHFRRSLPEEVVTKVDENSERQEEQYRDETNEHLSAEDEKAMLHAAMMQNVLTPFYMVQPNGQMQQQMPAILAVDRSKLDLEKGGFVAEGNANGLSSALASSGTPKARLALLLHQLLRSLWAVLCVAFQAVWKLVPKRIAVPTAAFAASVAASPAVTAAGSAISSFASTAVTTICVRPLMVRAVLAVALVGTYLVVGAAPMMAALMTAMGHHDQQGSAAAGFAAIAPSMNTTTAAEPAVGGIQVMES